MVSYSNAELGFVGRLRCVRYAHVPPSLRVDNSDAQSTNELGLHVRSRYRSTRVLIHRPFLYLIVHDKVPPTHQRRALIEHYAQECIESCIVSINDTTYHHRHHGTWYTARIAFNCALCILAAAKSTRMSISNSWHAAILRTITILRFWEGEAINLQLSRQVLESLAGSVFETVVGTDTRNQI
jgi:hypothetical protein